MSKNQFAAALSTRTNLQQAIVEASDRVRATLGSAADVAVVFIGSQYESQLDDVGPQLSKLLNVECVLGCTAEGVIAEGREIEDGTGVAVWAAKLPDAHITSFHLEFQRTPEGSAFVGWPDELVEEWQASDTLLLLADPYTFPADYLLERLNEDHPGCPVLGGMASGASRPGDNRLFVGQQMYSDGAVGWRVRDLSIQPVVSQGCRPIGDRLVVTAAERNVIKQLGGRPALEQLRRIFVELPTHEQAALQRGLHVGRVVSEYQDEFQMGDFLIRNVLGLDHESGSIAIGDFVRPGQTVQFHIRDEAAADGELRQLLVGQVESQPKAGLIFSCNGRGTRLFSQADHDAEAVKATLGDIPLVGFFAQGEIGPVGSANFLHGFTASLALFS
ncbi:MAG: FIST C-terminal domain-containing protein [Planctomycetales bacterium]|nr:FIST C-terminal domain-containing protein [Planctomycetales bacterium]